MTLSKLPDIAEDFDLEVAKGSVSGHFGVNKFGKAPAGIQTTITDIWDRADASPTQQLWVAPTQARIHDITSSSTNDDGTPEAAGSGAQAVRIWGLTDWDTKEVNEDVILNGTANVATSNLYVIIHRVKVIKLGNTYNINAGTITATAQTDNTVTAQIDIGNGQTLMAIYGVPSVQTLFLKDFEINSHNTGNPSTVVEVDFEMLVNENPDIDETVFLVKANIGLIASGTSSFIKEYRPPLPIPGPAIIKFQAISTLADTEGVAEFDAILIDN